jgi:hypothetical protein
MPGLRLPPMGTAQRRRPTPEGEGQPEPASIEPGPLEVAEQRRGERDDVVRESMAAQAAEGGRNEGYVTGFGERELSAIGDSCLKLYRFLSGQYNFEESMSGVVKSEAAEQKVDVSEAYAGKIFVIRRFSVKAPKGCKLRLYKGQIGPGGFVEVFTAAQEGAGEVPGTIRLRGKEHLIATVLGAEEAGTVVINLEGDLVNEEDLPW